MLKEANTKKSTMNFRSVRVNNPMNHLRRSKAYADLVLIFPHHAPSVPPPFLLRGTGFSNCVHYNRTRIVYTRNIVQGRREGGREGGREGRRPLACNGFPRFVIVPLCGTGEFFKKIKSPSISRREMVNNSKNPWLYLFFPKVSNG